MLRRANLVVLGLLAAACAQAAPAHDHGESDDVKAVEAVDPAAAKAAAVAEQEKAAAAKKQKAAEMAAAAEKEKYAAKAKAGYGEGGSIEDRLARIEKLLVALTDQTHARAAKDKAEHHHAKKDKSAAGDAVKDKAAWSADAQAQQEAMQAKITEVKHWLRLIEAERDELKARVKALEAENAALRPKVEPTK